MANQTLTPRHRKFAELIVQGYGPQAAYAATFPSSSSFTPRSRSDGSKLLYKPEIAAFIRKLRAEVVAEVSSEAVITRHEAMEYLTEVIRTPPGLVEAHHRICQTFKKTPSRLQIKIPCKLRAVELAMKFQGLLCNKVQPEVRDTLTDFLVSLRAGDLEALPPEEQKLNPDHQKFAELIIQGQTGKAAYLSCFPLHAETTARSESTRIQSRPEVAAYIAETRAELAEKVHAETVLTLKEALEYLTAVVRTPAGLVKEGDPLCLKFKQTPNTLRIELPCKLRALELAMKLQGFLSDKVQHEAGDSLQDFLTELRAGGAE